ncbi:MAG TPA: hypothetical protein VF660_06380, partial [Actinomycetota bacterium]
MRQEAARDRISVLICDDHRLLTDTLRAVVENDPSLELISEPLHRPDQAIAVCAEKHPDVA